MKEVSDRQKVRALYTPPPPEDSSKNYCRLAAVIAISLVFIAGEVIGGKIAGSIAIISDAIHLVSDLVGFIFSFVFLYLSKKAMDERVSFGYHRMELLGALANLFIVWLLVIFVIYEATQRIFARDFVQNPTIMLITAIAGLAVNVLMYMVLHGGDSHSHGLLAEECHGHDDSHAGHHHGHHHGHGHGNDRIAEEDSSQDCSDLCKDEICMKTVNEAHCHKGSDRSVHRHRNVRKLSEEPHVHGADCSHKHEVESDPGHEAPCEEEHDHQPTCYLKPVKKNHHEHVCEGHGHEGHSHAHHDHSGHQHGEKCSHKHEEKKEEHHHEHGEKCSHNHNKEQKQTTTHNHQEHEGHHHEGEHKHGEGCSHNHNKEEKQTTHNHEEHDHAGHKHEGHNHSGHQHGEKCSHNHASHQEVHNHQDHDHSGHDHQGHDHQGHDHQGHDHQGHDHQGHDHKGHDHQGHDHQGHDHKPKQSIGMQAAVLHALSDVVQSVGVVVSAIVIYIYGSNGGHEVTEWNSWHLFDPISTYVFSLLSLISTFPIIRNCYYLIMQSTPDYVDLDVLRGEFENIPGVIDVHDIHVWDLKPGKTIIIAHVLARAGKEREVLTMLTDMCRTKRIYHSTFQVEEQDLKDDEGYISCKNDIHH